MLTAIYEKFQGQYDCDEALEDCLFEFDKPVSRWNSERKIRTGSFFSQETFDTSSDSSDEEDQFKHRLATLMHNDYQFQPF